MTSDSAERGAFKHIPLVSACVTRRKKAGKNYLDKG